METKINVAAIMKNKPKGIKLYDWLHNLDVELDEVATTEIETVIWCTKKDEDYNELFGYSQLGTLRGWFDGLQILFPSKEMRDWGKFAWKKGDVLVHRDGDVHIIFERFVDDTYCSFVGKYYLWKENNDTEQFYKKERLLTSDFNKANKEEAQTYINTIEEKLGSKLNRETLEIEKTQPEFKDGDIVCISGMGYLTYGIVKSIDYLSKKLEYYVLNDMSTLKFEDWLSFEDKQIQPITETQQIILFDALAKKNKAWDAEKKMIVDLKPNIELKPFDKVLVRDFSKDKWSISFFSFKEEDFYVCINHCSWNQCIPYIGNESLLGTTKDVEGQVWMQCIKFVIRSRVNDYIESLPYKVGDKVSCSRCDICWITSIVPKRGYSGYNGEIEVRINPAKKEC